MSDSSPEPSRRHRRRRWPLAVVALAAVAALIDVTVTGPRVAVRWIDGLDAPARQALEQRYALGAGRAEETTWRYELRDWSRDNIAALVRDPAAADTAYIDRRAFTADPPTRVVGIRPLPFPFSADAGFPDRRRLFHLQSLCALAAAAGLLSAARRNDPARRRLSIAMLLLFAVSAYAFPIDPVSLQMGDSTLYTSDRDTFEQYLGVSAIRFEAHLSYGIAGRIYEWLGADPGAPGRALTLLMRAATAWFVLWALAIGMLERWSPVVVRYLGLALLAPSALLFFGYREIGHLSLNLAAFPLLARGLRLGAPRLEAGAVLSGIGAALHGFGLMALAGAALAASVAPGTILRRLRQVVTITAWGTAAYAGWIAVYVVVLKLPVTQGHAEAIPFRPWLADQIVGDRVNAAILSATGARDLFFTAWVVGAPLLAVAASLWRQHREEVRMALAYAVPSVLLSIVFWPIQGLGVEMDLVVAAFPAFYAAAWVCAHDARRTTIAAVLLASAHLAFWRIVMDDRFVT